MLLARGRMFMELSENEAAQRDFSKAIQLQPSCGAYISRARLCVQEKRFHAAISDARQAEKLDPVYLPTYQMLGYLYQALGDIEEAVNNYSKGIALNPSDEYCLQQRGHCYRLLNNEKKAIADLTHALEINPKDAFVFWEMGEMLEKAEQWQGAIDAFNQYLRYTSKENNDYFVKAQDRIKTIRSRNK
jgi:tetratricopeptide (TPR) repeat protein